MKILATGFDPFGGDTVNPALEAIKRLPHEIAGAEIVTLAMPTIFQECAAVAKEAIEREDPDVIVGIGQAGGRFAITPERVAINQDDARIADNAGNQPIDAPIQVDGEAAYFSQLPIKAIVAAIRKAGIPSEVSNSAGTFVCNHIMYQLLYLTHTAFPDKQAGFIHIPFLPEQVTERPGKPSMALDDIVKGLTIALATIVEYRNKADLVATGGKEA